jgi:hypothetical protein
MGLSGVAATRRLMVVGAVVVTALSGAASAHAMPPTVLNPIVEAQNFSVTLQRQAIYDTPAYAVTGPGAALAAAARR